MRKPVAIAMCVLAAALMGGAGAVRAQEPAGAASAPATHSTASGPAQPATDEGLRLLDNSPPRIIQPRDQRKGPAPPAPRPMPGMLVEARARLHKVPSANWYMLAFEREPNRPPRGPTVVLPCQFLEQIESLAEGNPPPLLRVSGETTTYRRKSFILLREVLIDEGSAGPASVPPVEANQPAARTRPEPETQPALPAELAGDDANRVFGGTGRSADPTPPSAATSQASSTLADPDDILQQLSRERPGKSVAPRPLTPQTQLRPATSVSPVPQTPLANERGTILADRVVQIVAEDKDGWLAIHFVGDNTLREPPIRLLPCALLERAESRNATAVKFRVSGELSEYKGRRYLFLRKLIVERDLGQL